MKMTKLEELIKEHCPNGVEKVYVSDICYISRGVVISKDDIRDNPGKYPVFSSQTENGGCLGRIGTYAYDGKYITWTTDGANAGTVFYREGKFSITNVCGLLKIKANNVDIKYLYYILSIEAPKFVNSGMGNPKLMSNVMARIQIPLPPLAVQREIVRILDKFTLYSQELAAELAARRVQYEYYRDQLVSFNNKTEQIKWVLLQEILEIKNGSDYKRFGEGQYPVYGSGGVMTYIDNFIYDKPSVLIPRKGSLNNLFYVETPFWTVDTIFYTIIDTTKVVPKFVFYYLQNQHLEKLNKAGGVPSLTQSVLNLIKIPIPPLEVQERIVKVLDNFDAICSDLGIGLPAEIEKRQQQYEFYRDKLLTFGTGSATIFTDRQTDRHSATISCC